jgi:hypothetical protein
VHVVSNRSVQVQYLITRLAIHLDQKYRLAQILHDQGQSGIALEVALDHLLEPDIIV